MFGGNGVVFEFTDVLFEGKDVIFGGNDVVFEALFEGKEIMFCVNEVTFEDKDVMFDGMIGLVLVSNCFLYSERFDSSFVLCSQTI
jgi:hypothetical protein